MPDAPILKRWLVKVGDRVEPHQVVAEIETTKATIELPAPAAGVVLALLTQPGQALPASPFPLVIG